MPRSKPKGWIAGVLLVVVGSYLASYGFSHRGADVAIFAGAALELTGFVVLAVWWSRRLEYSRWKRRGAAWAEGREDVIRSITADELHKQTAGGLTRHP